MADARITELTALTAPDINDPLAIVDDPSGSPVTKKITVGNLTKQILDATAKTSNYTLTTSDRLIFVDATSGAVTISVPAASGNQGIVWIVKKIDSSANAVIIDPDGAETIDGDSSYSLTTENQVISFTSNGTNIVILTDATDATGTGDVVGPASATDNAITRFDGTTGKLLQNSAVTIDDSGNIATSGTVDGRDVSVDGTKLDGIEAGADVTDATNVNAAGAVMNSDYTPAHSLLVQQSGTGSPSSLAVSNNSFIGKQTGDITSLSAAAARTILNVEDGAEVNTIDTVSDTAEIDLTVTSRQLTASIVAGSIDESKLDTSVNASLDLADSALQSVDIADINATGTPSGSTFLRGDGAWATPAGSVSPLSAQGDLYTFDTDDARLPVGTNGQILTADSTQPTGLRWADPSSAQYDATAFTSQTSVTVTHNFGAYPIVNVIDNTGAQIIPLSVTHASVNAFTVTFSVSTTGTILSTSGGASSAAVFTNVVNNYTKTQYFGTTTLTDGATINWDLDSNQVAKVTLGGNRTMAAPTNLKDGATYILRIIQDGTGSRTITWNAAFKWAGGAAPTLSTAANAIDIITFTSDGTNMYGVPQLNFS